MSLLRAFREIIPLRAQTRCRPETRTEAELNANLQRRKATRETYSAVQRQSN